jgi:aminoglycoside phosphotransferase (APT) family kinase protein
MSSPTASAASVSRARSTWKKAVGERVLLAAMAGEDVLVPLSAALVAEGHPHGRLVLTHPPQLHARSSIYFVGDAEQPDRGCRWVVKRPDTGAQQEDLPNPLDARRQYTVLRMLEAHYEPLAPALRVSRPVAFLEDSGALAMEYAPGIELDSLLRPRSVFDPKPLLDGIALAGRFLRHLHAFEPPHHALVRPRGLGEELLALVEQKMRPAGFAPPAELSEVLEQLPDTEDHASAVCLHGDFAPVNMIVEGGTSVTGIDISLAEVGFPEDDLARFLMMLATARLFVAGAGARRTRALRQRAQLALLEAYYGEARTSALLELRFIRQLCLRWLRRCMARIESKPRLGGVRRRLVDRHFETLVRERSRALTSTLGNPLQGARAGRDEGTWGCRSGTAATFSEAP